MTQYQQPTHAHSAQESRNGLGTAALVLGIVGLGIGWIPIVGFAGFICGLVGIGLGIGGLVRANRGGASNGVMAGIGILLSVLALFLSTFVFAAFAQSVSAAAPASTTPGAFTMPQAPALTPSVAPVQTGPATSFGDGVYEVGVDIEAGKYKTTGASGGNCYYARLKTGDGSIGDILDNNNVSGPATVTIKASDGIFTSQGCNAWVKAG